MNVKLKELGKIITGNTPSKSIAEFYNSDDIGFVKPDIISEQQIDYIENTTDYLAEAARNKARIVKKNTVFVTCIGSIGKIGIVKSNELAFNQQINAIEPNEKVLPKYLAYGIFANKRKLQAISNAPVVPIINKKQFGEFEIDITNDTREQLKIVELLDKVNEVIEKRKEELENLDELIKARFIEMFGDVLEEEKVTIAEICKIITDGTHQPPKFTDTGIPFLLVSNIITNDICYDAEKFISEETYAELIKRTPIEIGDILLSTVGSYGHPAIVKTDRRFCFQRHIAYLKPKSDMVKSEYLHGAILSDDVQRQIDTRVKGIAQKTLNLSEIRKIRLPLPPMKLQEKFTTFVAQTDKSKVAVQKALDEAQLLFDSLMQKYFG